MFRFPVMLSTFGFPKIAILAITAASLLNYFRLKGAAESVFMGENKVILRVFLKIILGLKQP